MLTLLRQYLRNHEHRACKEGQRRSRRDTFEATLSGLRNVIVDSLLDEVAGGVDCGQRLASIAGLDWSDEIRISFEGDHAADSEGC